MDRLSNDIPCFNVKWSIELCIKGMKMGSMMLGAKLSIHLDHDTIEE